MAIKKGFSQYALGNDYDPMPVSVNWETSSYLDGIFQEAKGGYAEKDWNKLFKTTLPQSGWDEYSISGAIYSKDYATASAVAQSFWDPSKYVSGADAST